MASDIGQSTVQSENKAGVAENKTLTADNDKTYRIDVEKLDYINLFNPLHSLATFCGLSLKVKRPGTWASAASTIPLSNAGQGGRNPITRFRPAHHARTPALRSTGWTRTPLTSPWRAVL